MHIQGAGFYPFSPDQFGPFGAFEQFKSVLDGLDLKGCLRKKFKNTHFKSEPSKTLLNGSNAPKWTKLVRKKWTGSYVVYWGLVKNGIG